MPTVAIPRGGAPAQVVAHDSGAVVLVHTSRVDVLSDWSVHSGSDPSGPSPLLTAYEGRNGVYARVRQPSCTEVWRLQYKSNKLVRTPLVSVPHLNPNTGVIQVMNENPTLWYVPHSRRYYLLVNNR